MAAKIMLVEDDTNLSEIYKARLEAEGFLILSAKDGEEALAMAVRERPDLIICDVMMPKISGFDMLDILRGTDGIKDTRVIMMTALGQNEDKARAEKLGADRYLVKSQVTLEDVVKTVHDVLEDENVSNVPVNKTPASGVDSSVAQAQPNTTDPIVSPSDNLTDVAAVDSNVAPALSTTDQAQPSNNDSSGLLSSTSGAVTPSDKPSVVDNATAPDSTNEAVLPASIPSDNSVGSQISGSQPANVEQSAVQSQIQDFLSKQRPVEAKPNIDQVLSPNTPTLQDDDSSSALSQPQLSTTPDDTERGDNNAVNVAHKKVIQPISDMKSNTDLAALLAKEEASSPSNLSTDGFFTPSSTPPNNHESS